uniref:Uncharacterized protein n=1 Tax=Triticum urartu TaxID=4572 RepID=A0A8R7PDG0_TRIUA
MSPARQAQHRAGVRFRRALRPAIHPGELAAEVGLPGRVPPRGVVRRVVGGGAHERDHLAVEPAGVGRDVLVVDAVRPPDVVHGGEGAGVGGVVERAGVVVDGGVLVVGALVLHILEGHRDAAGAGRGVGVAPAEHERPDLVWGGADHGGGEEVRGRGDVLGQRRGEEAQVGLVRAVGCEVGRRAAHLPQIRRCAPRQQHDGEGCHGEVAHCVPCLCVWHWQSRRPELLLTVQPTRAFCHFQRQPCSAATSFSWPCYCRWPHPRRRSGSPRHAPAAPTRPTTPTRPTWTCSPRCYRPTSRPRRPASPRPPWAWCWTSSPR